MSFQVGIGSLRGTLYPSANYVHFIDLVRKKGWVDFGVTQWFWTQDPWCGNSAPSPLGQYWDHYSSHGSSLNDEALNTLIIEVEVTVNSRPLTIETIADGASRAAMLPSNLLTMKSKIVMPPPGSFRMPDFYSRRRWRKIQHIANEFWSWWRNRFLTSVQTWSKWSKSRCNLTVGDIVLLKTSWWSKSMAHDKGHELWDW